MLADYISTLSPAELFEIIRWTPAVLLGIFLAVKINDIKHLLR